MKNSTARSAKKVSVRRINGPVEKEDVDFLAAEEPLEIRIEGHSVAVVMRTPGDDRELTAGFMVTEGLVSGAGDVIEIRHLAHCSSLKNRPDDRAVEVRAERPGPADSNVINVRLKDPESIDHKKLTRHVFTSSSCGICSKATIEAVRQQFPALKNQCEVTPQVLMELPGRLATVQETFKQTGGLHACALFNLEGDLLIVREDVGRHNALDKVIGWALLAGRLPLHNHILLLSGRTSFEMLQKALAAGIPIVAAISAPSSLAVEFARESGQTLIGFLREGRMNIYSGAHRISRVSQPYKIKMRELATR